MSISRKRSVVIARTLSFWSAAIRVYTLSHSTEGDEESGRFPWEYVSDRGMTKVKMKMLGRTARRTSEGKDTKISFFATVCNRSSRPVSDDGGKPSPRKQS